MPGIKAGGAPSAMNLSGAKSGITSGAIDEYSMSLNGSGINLNMVMFHPQRTISTASLGHDYFCSTAPSCVWG